MENASKALLIAASVLVAILLIAFAVKTLNSTSGINKSQQDTMKSAEVSQFNSKFTQYVGSNKSRAQVISLLNAVIANNKTSNHKINIHYKGGADADRSNLSHLLSNIPDKKFKIYIDDENYDANGYITKISIDEL